MDKKSGKAYVLNKTEKPMRRRKGVYLDTRMSPFNQSPELKNSRMFAQRSTGSPTVYQISGKLANML